MNSIDKAVDLENDSPVIFEIKSGESASRIASNLKSEDLIKSAYGFSKYLSKEDLDSQIQAGRYILNRSMTGVEIAETLLTIGSGEMAVTIIEGWTISDIDNSLAKANLIEPGEFKTCTETCDFSDYDFLPGYLEGYLFPDTFFIDPETFSAESFIRRLLTNFQSKVQITTGSLEETIIVASIIEKEVRTEEDRALVSGIIWKRLDNGWALGMCSTINYITGETEITHEDIAIDSPYNTRKYAGLPPTPISNPGLASIEAAANPEYSEYWYFLTATETGETIYSVTNEEHEVNKAKYL
ncbi:endolytic transglycosylase MltG [Patescibacteria group bacterium]|nr:endolytic transglycosylase MltG [Patescibacteria group bacterium]